MEGIVNKFDPDIIRNRNTTKPYPNIIINDLNRCIPIVVSCLIEGDIPLLGTLNGTTKIIKKIDRSALNIEKLLRISSITVYLTEKEYYNVSNVKEYMEVCFKWI